MTDAYFAGGCFWCITPVFAKENGVKKVRAGYCGGDEQEPVYADVKAQRTGHRETIRVTYDPAKTDYSRLLEIFLNHVDPFDGGGQYIDRGFSYTLAVYWSEPGEEEAALKALEELEKASGRKPCVSVEKLKRFWDAEEYHQNYYLTHPKEFEKELVESGRKNKE